MTRHLLRLVLAAAALGAPLPQARAQESAPPAVIVVPPPPGVPAGQGAPGDGGGAATSPAPEAVADPAAPAAVAGDPPPASSTDAAPDAAADTAGAPPPASAPAPLSTDADPIVEAVILPAAVRLNSAAIALQNAVIRHCMVPSERSYADMEAAFAEAVVAAASTAVHGFGTADNRDVPARLSTAVANTAFSRSRLDAIMTARIMPPATLAELSAEEPGLTGLPALEWLLLRPPYTEAETLRNRCSLAIPIAGKLRSTAYVVAERWRRRAVEPQWTSDEPELADRLRLRDLIQAMIDVSDRLGRDVAMFGPDPLGNERLPFGSKRLMERYLDSAAAALLREAEVVSRFAPPTGPESDALARVVAALEQGRELLPGSDPERIAAMELFGRAQEEVAQLPAAFNFAPEAFQRPLASFQPATVAPPASSTP